MSKHRVIYLNWQKETFAHRDAVFIATNCLHILTGKKYLIKKR